MNDASPPARHEGHVGLVHRVEPYRSAVVRSGVAALPHEERARTAVCRVEAVSEASHRNEKAGERQARRLRGNEWEPRASSEDTEQLVLVRVAAAERTRLHKVPKSGEGCGWHRHWSVRAAQWILV